MKYPIEYSQTTVETEFYKELIEMHEEAKAYLMDFAWCRKIIQSYIYLNLGSNLCIFLFKIDNIASNDDDFLWVIVGDIPSMYLDIHGPRTTKQVLEDYVRLAEDWIDHVKLGKSIKNCYPFTAEPTIEMATLLEKRTLFMKNTLIDNIDDTPLLIK
jgi:hypothetical protein